ncbi:MAG: sulfotransferase family protein [Planctomycetota bacterium]|jgi:hypothetical protein
MFDRPVIIVGAPRSGTSLLQQIIREHSSFVSVAREADVIWEPFCHPAKNNWDGDGCRLNELSSDDLRGIRQSFERYAVSSRTWKTIGRSGILKNAVVQRLAKRTYRPIYALSAWLLERCSPGRNRGTRRLVDKSVRDAFWLEVVDAVFPDALYIHIVRDGRYAVDSMIDGWLNPARFNTYTVPGGLNIGGYEGKHWCFLLPPGWREYCDSPLEEVVAFQWLAVQQRILEFRESLPQGRFLTVKLEEMSSGCESLFSALAGHIQVPYSAYFESLRTGVPVVNASDNRTRKGDLRYPDHVDRVAAVIESVNTCLGY